MHDRALSTARGVAKPDGPLVLVVLDGVGVGSGDEFDSVAQARTPTLDELRDGLATQLAAHGTAVGLSDDTQIGNSEVGHNILGAGRVFPQGGNRVDRVIESGELWRDPSWTELLDRAGTSVLHLVGLVSDGGVHSEMKHLKALIDAAITGGVGVIRVHMLFDGRDVPDNTAEQFAEELVAYLSEVGGPDADARVASAGGRMTTTMDRYGADWSIVERGWVAHVQGAAEPVPGVMDGLEWVRGRPGGESDQTLEAFTIVDEAGEPVGRMEDGDVVLLFNFRPDRIVEFTEALTAGPEFSEFDRGDVPRLHVYGITQYDGDRDIPERYLVKPPEVSGTLSERLAATGLRQYACAETQKYGHITFFWNGNSPSMFDPELEEYREIPSDVGAFNHRPWMKSAETADALCEAIASGRWDFVRANFASGDMVGHTGDFDATCTAMVAVDLAVRRIRRAVREAKGVLVVTADHGNADEMAERDAAGEVRRRDGRPVFRTAHTTNPVPFWVDDWSGRQWQVDDHGSTLGLSNVAATLCLLLGLEPPSEYDPPILRPVR